MADDRAVRESLGLQNLKQGKFGEAFVAVLAAAAGMSSGKPDPDNGIDLWVADGYEGPIELQVKSTSAPGWIDSALRYDLDIEAYERLRRETTSFRFLVVVVVPPSPHEWTVDSGALTMLRWRAYYLNLRAAKPTANASTVTVSLPTDNVLTPKVVKAMVEGRCE